MRYQYILSILLALCTVFGIPLAAQNTSCGPEAAEDSSGFAGTVFFNYGSHARSKSQNYRTSVAVGQTFVGYMEGPTTNTNLGFYARYLLPPFALKVNATQGELLDRIQLTWEIDALGPTPNAGFNIYRDGVFLATVGANIRNYNDFNVIPGTPYVYTVRGLNVYGEGVPSSALGFQVPNGVVTGLVRTNNGNPVPDALVTLTPMQGFSALFGDEDGAMVIADTTKNDFLPPAGEDWTMAFWLQTDLAAMNSSLIRLSPFPLYIKAMSSTSGHEGIEVASASNQSFLSAQFADSTKNGWHHVALTYDGNTGTGRLYVDGALASLSPMTTIPAVDTIHFGHLAGNGGWVGRMDEFRLYHRLLDELDFPEVMEGTASSQTPFLTHYWKMDEELGEKSYDIVNRHPLYFCGASFDAQRPPVHTAGKTNADGYYRIESASYGTGTTFLAKPKKDFFLHRSLKLNRNEEDYATLPDFSITPKATIELWVNSAGPNGSQCLLSKKWGSNEFRIMLEQNGLDNQLVLYLNGNSAPYGPLGNGYQHLAFTWNDETGEFVGYKNGVFIGSSQFGGVSGDWSDITEDWILGARKSGAAPDSDFFGGLIDELAVYDTTLAVSVIQQHAQSSRDIQEDGLRVYFSLDEGNGNRLGNMGSIFLEPGMTFGTQWSAFAANQMVTPHVFTPATRQVTLNPSVTSVDQIDFIDQSTVAVSGYVRYKNTECFAKNIEILVNGESFSPKIFTDSLGKFVIDFDPGATARIAPVFEDHLFVPAFWDVANVTSPIAGILFNDITTRKISGQVAGGLCKKSIIKAPPGTGQGTVCVVKVRTVDGCLERIVTLDNVEGHFEFDELPPIENMTVAVVEHSDPDIKTAFQIQGGSTINLSKKDTIIDFIYFAMPEVEIVSGLDPYSPTCDVIVLDQYETIELGIKLKEQYEVTQSDNGVCYIDSAHFNIINGFAEETLDTAMSNGLLVYKFKVATPNPSPPYLKTLEIIGSTLNDNETQLIKQAVVTGIRTKLNTFTTTLPERPTMVLRDPPGDGSYAFIEKHEKFCQKLSFSTEMINGVGLETVIDLGPDAVIPIFFGAPNAEFESQFGPIITANTSFSRVKGNSMEVCSSMDERLSTSDDELIVGGEQGGDVFVGGGLNVEFGFADIVRFDSANCTGYDSIALLVAPGNYATTFMYSEFNIENNVIRYLESLAANATDTAQEALYLESLARWNKILDDNDSQKMNAEFIRNISFDAGVSYEYSETSDTITEVNAEEGQTITLDVDLVAQAYALGIGGGVTVKVAYEEVTGRSEDFTTEKGVTTGYVLADNEPGDAFTIDVAMDSVYKTPVFRLKAGQSSCPWEPGTANREGPNLQLSPGSGFVQTDVPANEPAVFQMQLGNLSASNEDWTYGFSAIGASNPNGAVIKLNGAVLNSTQSYIIPYGTSQTVTLTIERGPVEYEYDSLLVALYSECEFERNLALSLPLEGDANFFSPLYLGAHFIRPCSEVNINVPEQDWVLFPDPLTPGSDDIRRITVSGYDTTEVNFQLIRVQYRRSDGDGAWINIPGISDRYNSRWTGFNALPDPKPPTLQKNFTQFFWETTGLSDGPYEIRAVAICTGDALDRPGYSQVIKGRIDREPPSLVGVPQPSDGVYQVGDEISFTFNQEINCNKLIQADLVNDNNVGLYDAGTNTLIDAHITCVDNKIVIDPLFQNEFYENHILRAELHNIEDLTGNRLIETQWEFYVDRNELAWLTDSIGLIKYADDTKTISAKIHNRGGYPTPFSIQNIPDWVHVSPNTGTLVANEIRDIQFTVDSTVALGIYSDSIILHTETGQNPFFMGGDEVLPIGLRVLCRPPYWNVNSADFELSMNMNLQLVFNTLTSTDPEDEVGVFIEGQLRGKGKPVYSPSLGYYVAYVTVYGNGSDEGKPLVYELFDASECLHHPGTLAGNFQFVPNSVVGTASTPGQVFNSELLIREIKLLEGWNWISFNLEFSNSGINSVLSNLPKPDDDLIKSQTKFATYKNPGWSGSLKNLDNKSLYLYQANQANLLKITGAAISPSSVSVPVVSGWNWIGYIPNYPLPINEALASLNAQPGDLIKSQSSFAQYVNSTIGWVGSLTKLKAPNGYMLKMAQSGTLNYPPQLNGPNDRFDIENRMPEPSIWTLDATDYEYNMTIIGMIAHDDINVTSATMELGAFVDEEVRGSGQAIYIEALNAYLFYLTTYANSVGEPIEFRLYDAETGTIEDIRERMTFVPNGHSGSTEEPVPFSIGAYSGTTQIDDVESFVIMPNPFSTETTCHISLAKGQDITLRISDVGGREISNVQMWAEKGLNKVNWNGMTSAGATMNNGVYFVQLTTDHGTLTHKVVLQR